jgi:hypothetical protein
VGSPNTIPGNARITAEAVKSTERGSKVIVLCEHQASIICWMKVLRRETNSTRLERDYMSEWDVMIEKIPPNAKF